MKDIRNLKISSTNPCLIIYLIDQSYSMSEQFGNASHSKAVELANAINETLYEIGLKCITGTDEIKNRFEISVIGYGKGNNKVESAWEGGLAGKWVVPIRGVFDFTLDEEEGQPIWIKPYFGSNTPMTKAFENAYLLCEDWINWGNHMDCHPPIVINITDGEPTDAGRNYNQLRERVRNIRELKTNYGEVIVLNIHISNYPGDKLLFPDRIDQSNKQAEILFDISSPLNDNMIRLAKKKGYNIVDGARGYVYNGNNSDLLNFLEIGSDI